MGFWDKFRRKKVSLQSVASAELHQKSKKSRKKRAKKRIAMKRAKPKHSKVARKSARSGYMNLEDGTTTKKWLQKDRELLGGALRDLNRELQSLRNTRKGLEMKMANFSSQLGDTQNKEISLRNKISEMMKKEAVIIKKKTIAKDKMAMVDQKIEKVKTIQTGLKSI